MIVCWAMQQRESRRRQMAFLWSRPVRQVPARRTRCLGCLTAQRWVVAVIGMRRCRVRGSYTQQRSNAGYIYLFFPPAACEHCCCQPANVTRCTGPFQSSQCCVVSAIGESSGWFHPRKVLHVLVSHLTPWFGRTSFAPSTRNHDGAVSLKSDVHKYGGTSALFIYPILPRLYVCLNLEQPVVEELLPPEKMLVPTSGQAIDFRVEMKRLLDSIMANYGQFMEMLVRYVYWCVYLLRSDMYGPVRHEKTFQMRPEKPHLLLRP